MRCQLPAHLIRNIEIGWRQNGLMFWQETSEYIYNQNEWLRIIAWMALFRIECKLVLGRMQISSQIVGIVGFICTYRSKIKFTADNLVGGGHNENRFVRDNSLLCTLHSRSADKLHISGLEIVGAHTAINNVWNIKMANCAQFTYAYSRYTPVVILSLYSSTPSIQI